MTIVQVPEGMAVPLKANIMSNRKVMLTKDTPLSSHLAVYLFVCFVALRPKSTAMVIAGRSVHLATLFPGQA